MSSTAKSNPDQTSCGLLTPRPRPSGDVSHSLNDYSPDLNSFNTIELINDDNCNSGNQSGQNLSPNLTEAIINARDVTIGSDYVPSSASSPESKEAIVSDFTIGSDYIPSPAYEEQDQFRVQQIFEIADYDDLVNGEVARLEPLPVSPTKATLKISTPNKASSVSAECDSNGFPVLSFLNGVDNVSEVCPNISSGGGALSKDYTPPIRDLYNGTEPMKNLDDLNLEALGLRSNRPPLSQGGSAISFKISGLASDVADCNFGRLSISALDGGYVCKEAGDKFVYTAIKATNDAKFFKTRTNQLQCEVNQLLRSHGARYETAMESFCASFSNFRKEILRNIETNRDNGNIGDAGVDRLRNLL